MMPTNMHAPRGGRGLRDGMTVELHNGTVIEAVERLAPRDTRFRGHLVVSGWHPASLGDKAYPLAEAGDVVTFAQCNVKHFWRKT